jgi:hypothetical protein
LDSCKGWKMVDGPDILGLVFALDGWKAWKALSGKLDYWGLNLWFWELSYQKVLRKLEILLFLKNNGNKWKSSGNGGMFVALGKQRVLFNPGYLVKLPIVRGNCSFPLEGYPD